METISPPHDQLSGGSILALSPHLRFHYHQDNEGSVQQSPTGLSIVT
jgi:hypothetical protein